MKAPSYYEHNERQAGSTALDVVEWRVPDPEPSAIEVREFETYEAYLEWVEKRGEGR